MERRLRLVVLDRDLFGPARLAGSPVQSINWWDAQIADALLHQGRTGFSFYHGLARAVEWYLGLSAEGKGTTQLSYTETEALSQEQVMYAAADAVETLWVAEKIEPALGLKDCQRLQVGASGSTFLTTWKEWTSLRLELGTAALRNGTTPNRTINRPRRTDGWRPSKFVRRNT